MAVNQWFYDNQLRRYILQFVRLFSNFQVQRLDSSSNPYLYRVPARYIESSRQVATIVQGNSENTQLSVPLIACYIESLSYDREHVLNPTHEDNLHIRERRFDADTGQYLRTQGNAYTITRIMPSPYTLTMKTEIWTSNTDQKWQLFEQISPLFNPAFEIQSTDNYTDWTSLTYVELTEVNYSSKSVPAGTEDAPDIMSLTFKVPIWITLPAKVKKLGIIEKIIISLYNANGGISDQVIDNELIYNDRIYITPMNYKIIVLNDQVQLLKENAAKTPPPVPVDNITPPEQIVDPNTYASWGSLIEEYGQLKEGISQIRLTREDSDSEIIGTVAYDPSSADLLTFTIDTDTIPSNTLASVTAIIDPRKSGPGSGLPAAALGTRYLLLDDIGSVDNATGNNGAIAWRGTNNVDLVANMYDIIEYDGTQWNISFDSSASTTVQYVTNLTSKVQYKWTLTTWVKSYEGLYNNGSWALVI